MKTPHKERELVLLSKTALMSEEALEKELINLENIFEFVESPSMFSKSHELVKRNRITRKASTLEKIYQKRLLKPFHFLVGKN